MNLDERQEKVRDKLVDCARERRVVTYTEAAGWVGTTPRAVGRDILDPINRYEHSEGRPLLSALVVRAEVGFPGSGFFAEASRLGEFKASSDNEYLCRIAFLHSEVQRVFDAHERSPLR